MARLNAGKSQRELAERLGLSHVYISEIERGLRAPLVRYRLLLACQFLGVSFAHMLALAGQYHGEVGLPVAQDDARNALAGELSAKWLFLTAGQVRAIAALLSPED